MLFRVIVLMFILELFRIFVFIVINKINFIFFCGFIVGFYCIEWAFFGNRVLWV